VEASNTPTIRRLTPHAVTNFRVHLSAMSTGTLTPEEALTVAGVIELRRKAIETHEWGERLAALEAQAERGR
jgi:hypothetical protein